MLTTIIAAAALAIPAATADWDLKAPYEADKTYGYLVEIEVDDPSSGEQVFVSLESVMTIGKAVDDGFEADMKWVDFEVDGGMMDDLAFSAQIATSGMLTEMENEEGENYREMFAPFLFVYPNKSVSVGDKWAYEGKDDKITVNLEAVKEETVKGTKTLKVTVKLVEGENGMKSTGDFWLTADGEVLKYELSLTDWYVPLVGQTFEAKVIAKKT